MEFDDEQTLPDPWETDPITPSVPPNEGPDRYWNPPEEYPRPPQEPDPLPPSWPEHEPDEN
jgi:hypothetical protein